MTTTKTPKTIADFTAGLEAAKAAPVASLGKLEAFQADCERRVAQPIGNDAAGYIRARLELAETKEALGESYVWALEARQQAAAEAYLEANAPEICAALRADIAAASKPQSDFIASKLKQAASITLNLFANKTDRHAIYQEREAAEQAAEDAEITLAAAVSAVRAFELMPTVQNFHAAAARVGEMNFPVSGN